MKWMILAAALLPMVSGPVSFAEDTKPAGKGAMRELTKEEREKMASTHEKMAACLRSDKTMADCHDEMRASCEAGGGKESCPMWGGQKGMGRGKGPKFRAAPDKE